jgi:hypothetical protein
VSLSGCPTQSGAFVALYTQSSLQPSHHNIVFEKKVELNNFYIEDSLL